MNLQSLLLLAAIALLAGWAWRQAGRRGRGGCGSCHGCSLHDHCSSRLSR